MIEPMIDRPIGPIMIWHSRVFELLCNSIKMLSMHKLESVDRFVSFSILALNWIFGIWNLITRNECAINSQKLRINNENILHIIAVYYSA